MQRNGSHDELFPHALQALGSYFADPIVLENNHLERSPLSAGTAARSCGSNEMLDPPEQFTTLI
jgi:hypothetical protein